MLCLIFTVQGLSQDSDVVICSEAIVVDQLPYTDSWCLEQPMTSADSIFYENTNSFLDPDSGCWHCLTLPRFYEINTGGFNEQLTMNVDFDLCATWGNCGQMVGYYTVFNDCPENGGTVLSYPSNGMNPSGECWDEFSGNDEFIAWSCWHDGCCGWDDSQIYCYPSIIPMGPFDSNDTDNGEAPWNFPTTQYSVTFNLEAFTTYYICIWPSGNCGSEWSDPTFTWGCIDVEFEGPIILAITGFDVYGQPNELPQFNIETDETYIIEHATDLTGWVEYAEPEEQIKEGWNYFRLRTPTTISEVRPYFYVNDPRNQLDWGYYQKYYQTNGQVIRTQTD